MELCVLEKKRFGLDFWNWSFSSAAISARSENRPEPAPAIPEWEGKKVGGTRRVPAALPSSIPHCSAGHSLAFPLGQQSRGSSGPAVPPPHFPRALRSFSGPAQRAPPGPLKLQRWDWCVWAGLDWAPLEPSQLNLRGLRPPLFSPFFPPFFPNPSLPAHCFAAAPHRGHNSDPRGGDKGTTRGSPSGDPLPKRSPRAIPGSRTKRAPSLPAESQKKIGIKSIGER